MLGGYDSGRTHPEPRKTPVVLTDNTALPALTIRALSKGLRKVELLFNRIEQHPRIEHFLGARQNEVETQVWCAVATSVLFPIVKKERQFEASQPDEPRFDPPEDSNQLRLFSF